MARQRKNDGASGAQISAFQHGDAERLNIPEATEIKTGLSKGKRTYLYSPHLSPKLQFDASGASDQISAIVEKVLAGQKASNDEAEILRTFGRQGAQPWLEWAAKQEQQAKGSFAVDDVVLHIHERISARAILATARREDVGEQDFFARPKLHQEQALQYYRHSMEWANRLILGDSLQVMSSLARRESLAGQVQMIFLDPPYGINFSSNWQNEMGQRTVQEKDEDLTREPEMIRAYRDTWMLGVHSYLSYLKERFLVARDLLADSGSIFVQISDENLHRVRAVMDEVFGPENFCSLITFRKKMMPLGADFTEAVSDYLVWYAKDRKAAKAKVKPLFVEKLTLGDSAWSCLEAANGGRRRLSSDEVSGEKELPSGSRIYQPISLLPAQYRPKQDFKVDYMGRPWDPPKNSCWKTDRMDRLVKAERVHPSGETLRYVLFHDDYAVGRVTNLWADASAAIDMQYVVQTSANVIQRCMLMATDPGDLVLDPTCGSGTTAFVAEQWGRRWITIDSSRVAVSIARQRILTACFNSYKTKDPTAGVDPTAPQDPAYGFHYKTVPHITLKSIAQNQELDPIFAKHEPILAAALLELNSALAGIDALTPLQTKLVEDLRAKVAADGARSIFDADLRRCLLPGTQADLLNFGTVNQRAKWKASIPKGPGWQEWEVPFDVSPAWPRPLQSALNSFRAAWRTKMDEVTAAIKANGEQEELIDQPEQIRGVTRVSGPFSVEGVRPEELALGEDGKLYDPTANSFDDTGTANADGYIDLMLGLLRKDGVTFLGNRRAEFASLEKEAGKSFHARGRWKGSEDGVDTVAVVFGPQYGPINAPMAVDAIESARGLKDITELVLAGFSFDSAAQENAKALDSPELRIHLAHIRPDVSPGMQGLLKETANSQLFTVFGQPDIRVVPAADGQVRVEMNGVCIYNPLTGEISESSSKKVAAWFVDTDYDGRCFCISQAFFPDKAAWSKLAKVLGSSVSDGAFEAFTTSWPFKPGKYRRIAVKVIDPRGNEVTAIQTLPD